ncbi:MAG: hypothetical protein K2N88_00010 [Muribaculaceae bacterium]|nr:hypothetical protein [Muribaculaceae bacterium]
MSNKTNVIITIILSILAWWPSEASAESQVVQMMEGEIRAGFTTPLGSYGGHGLMPGHGEIGFTFGLEGRYNIKGTPWDCGIALDLSGAYWRFDNVYGNGSEIRQTNRTLGFAAVGDYNFRQGKKVNPFAGVELGVAYNDVVGIVYRPSGGTSMLFAPRIGVELVHHIRLMARLNICRKGYNNFALTIGFVIGGRPKK